MTPKNRKRRQTAENRRKSLVFDRPNGALCVLCCIPLLWFYGVMRGVSNWLFAGWRYRWGSMKRVLGFEKARITIEWFRLVTSRSEPARLFDDDSKILKSQRSFVKSTQQRKERRNTHESAERSKSLIPYPLRVHCEIATRCSGWLRHSNLSCFKGELIDPQWDFIAPLADKHHV